ncbi:nectin-1-like isoform X2 [Heterodontus francisci]|uniref:nectin-1-like isoform X2 n=1 Tax=Heterodontus francisci TaxID=7792 RepID=UPI00355B8CB1
MTPVAWISSACIALLSVPASRSVAVNESLTAIVGNEVLLPCQIPNNNTKLVQLSWEKSTEETPLMVYNPRFGINFTNENYSRRIVFRNHSLQDASIIIKALDIQDEGNYSCRLTLFPQGIIAKRVHLRILAIPTNRAIPILTKAGALVMPVAICTSANGNPAANITWISNLPGNYTSVQMENDNGTITVTSQYKMAPSSSDNGRKLACVISHSALSTTENITVQLSILYPPEVTIKGYDGNWSENTSDVSLECVANANPPATMYSWQGLAEGLQTENAKIYIKKVNSLMNGNWTCEATNSVGIGKGEVEIIIKEGSNADDPEDLNTIHITIIIAVIVCVVVIVLALTLTWWKRRTQEIGVHQDGNSSETQAEQRIVYAVLDFSVQAKHVSAQREEESTVYAGVKYSQN